MICRLTNLDISQTRFEEIIKNTKETNFFIKGKVVIQLSQFKDLKQLQINYYINIM